jgi:UDP-glucuronate decarboxylase
MLELAENILKLTNSKSKIVHRPLPQDDPLQRQPNISLAFEKLNGWKPEVELKDGLEKTIKYFEKIIL